LSILVFERIIISVVPFLIFRKMGLEMGLEGITGQEDTPNIRKLLRQQ
jgi:hypothetical protein